MPYKEKDKLIHLFSLELGNITCILKGVSSPNAKLKFAGLPFCFGKFDLALAKDFHVVKGVECIDSFFDISTDYDTFRFSNLMLEICNTILKPNIISEKLFVDLLRSLQNILYNRVDAQLSSIKFMCNVLEIIGYKLNFHTCDNCGLKFMGDIKFDEYSGTFRCANCSGGVLISRQDFMSLKIIEECDINRLNTIKLNIDVQSRLFSLLTNNLSHRLNYKFKSLKE